MDSNAFAAAIYTPHPVTVEGQRWEELRVGETVQQLLDRVIEGADREKLEVRLNGALVPPDYWARVKPKANTVLEVRGIVRKQALYLVAMAMLTYWTMGAFSALGGAAGGTFFGLSCFAGYAAAMGAYMAGAARGGKVIR